MPVKTEVKRGDALPKESAGNKHWPTSVRGREPHRVPSRPTARTRTVQERRQNTPGEDKVGGMKGSRCIVRPLCASVGGRGWGGRTFGCRCKIHSVKPGVTLHHLDTSRGQEERGTRLNWNGHGAVQGHSAPPLFSLQTCFSFFFSPKLQAYLSV